MIWKFGSTGEAYDATQCDEEIKSGDLLLIEREGVVGIAHTWPVAITQECGHLHRSVKGYLCQFLTENNLAQNLAEGIALAKELGFTLEAELETT